MRDPHTVRFLVSRSGWGRGAATLGQWAPSPSLLHPLCLFPGREALGFTAQSFLLFSVTVLSPCCHPPGAASRLSLPFHGVLVSANACSSSLIF